MGIANIFLDSKLLNKWVSATKSQAYYDDLAKIWDKGVSYFNSRTGNTLYTSKNTTHIFSGMLPHNSRINNYGEIGKAREQLKIMHSPNAFSIARRKPDNYGIMNYLTASNATWTSYRQTPKGLVRAYNY